MKKILILTIFLIVSLLVHAPVIFADMGERELGCGCYCGKQTPPPCSAEACRQVCGWPESTTSSSSYSSSDYSGMYSALAQPIYSLGQSIGESIAQDMMGNPQAHAKAAYDLNNQGIQYLFNNQFQQAANAFTAALQESDDPIIRHNLEGVQQILARQAAQLAKEEAEARARKQQEMYDHITSQMKTSGDVKSASLGLNDLKKEDNDSGHVGIQSLPGIYLNDNNGNGSHKPYGIPGLPGVYVNGPGAGSGTAVGQPVVGGLQLMKDDDGTPSNTPNSSGAGVGQPVVGGLQLKKDDDSTPQPQTAIAAPLASLQQQADASQAAAGASSPEEASAQARAGFDTALPANNSAPPTVSAGSQSPTTTPASLQQQASTSQTAAGASSPEGAAPAQARGGFDTAPSGSGAVDLAGTHTTVVNPAIVNGSSSSLAGINPSDADKALMKLQWEMSIDPRYLKDPAVQQNIRDLWVAVRSRDYKTVNEAWNKLKMILTDQLKVDGQTPQQIADFFTKLNTIFNGIGSIPKEWSGVSKLANELDKTGGPLPLPAGATVPPPYYSQTETGIGPAESIKAPAIFYMGTATQTADDCVLYAIANGAQVPEKKVKDEFTTIANNLGMDTAAERANPEFVITTPQQGGRGGLDFPERLLVAEKFGKVIAVPKGSFARAIASTGRPVITTVSLNSTPIDEATHEVVVTGVYQTKNGKIYYSVMDSNLDGKKYNNSTDYVEKSFFEQHLTSGGFVVVKRT